MAASSGHELQRVEWDDSTFALPSPFSSAAHDLAQQLHVGAEAEEYGGEEPARGGGLEL